MLFVDTFWKEARHWGPPVSQALSPHQISSRYLKLLRYLKALEAIPSGPLIKMFQELRKDRHRPEQRILKIRKIEKAKANYLLKRANFWIIINDSTW
jgi:hypothetical protein